MLKNKVLILILSITIFTLVFQSKVPVHSQVAPDWVPVIHEDFEASTDVSEYTNFYSTLSSITTDPLDVLSGSNSLKVQTTYASGTWTPEVLGTTSSIDLTGNNRYRVSMQLRADNFDHIMIEVRTGYATNTKADMPYEFGLFIDEDLNTISRREGWIPLSQQDTPNESYSIDPNGIITLSFEFVADSTNNATIVFKGQTDDDNASFVIDEFKIEEGPRLNEDFENPGNLWTETAFWPNNGNFTIDPLEVIDGAQSAHFDFTDGDALYNVLIGGISSSKYTTALGVRHYVSFDIKGSTEATNYVLVLVGDSMYKEFNLDLVTGVGSGSFDNIVVTDETTHYHVTFDFVSSANVTNEFNMYAGGTLNQPAFIILDNFKMIAEDSSYHATPKSNNDFIAGTDLSVDYFTDFNETDLVSVVYNGNTLVDDTDYICNDNEIIFNNTYLNNLNTGTHWFRIYAGNGHVDVSIDITNELPFIDDSNLGDYSRLLALDLTLPINLFGKALQTVTIDGASLTATTDYIVQNSDTELVLLGSYLGNLTAGSHTLSLTTDNGTRGITFNVIDGVEPIVNKDRTLDLGTVSDVTYTINVDDLSVTDITLNGNSLSESDYTLQAGELVILASYLETLNPATHNFTLHADSDYPFSITLTAQAPSLTSSNYQTYTNSDMVFTVDTKGLPLQKVEFTRLTNVNTYETVLIDPANYTVDGDNITLLLAFFDANNEQNIMLKFSTAGGFVTSVVGMSFDQLQDTEFVLFNGFETVDSFDDTDHFFTDFANAIITDPAQVISGSKSLKIGTTYEANVYTGVLLTTEKDVIELAGGNAYKISMKLDVDSFQAIMLEVRSGWDTNTKADMPYEFGLLIDETNNTISRRPGWIPLNELNLVTEEYSIDENGIISLSFVFHTEEKAVIEFKGYTGSNNNASFIIDDFKVEEVPKMTVDFENFIGNFWEESAFWANAGSIITNNEYVISGEHSFEFVFTDNDPVFNAGLGGISNTDYQTNPNSVQYIEFDLLNNNAESFILTQGGTDSYSELIIDFVNDTYTSGFDNTVLTYHGNYIHVYLELNTGADNHTFNMYGGGALGVESKIVIDNIEFYYEDDTVHLTPVTNESYDIALEADKEYQTDLLTGEISIVSDSVNTLVEGTDYTYQDNQFILKEAYLHSLSEGQYIFTITAQSGTKDITVDIVNSTPVATTDSDYNQALQQPHDITVDLKGGTLTSVSHGNQVLVANTDYIVEGTTITMLPTFLQTLQTGSNDFTITSSLGSVIVSINVVAGDSPVETTSFTYNHAAKADILITINIPMDVIDSITDLDAAMYTITEGQITIPQATLDALDHGLHTFTIHVGDATFSFTIDVIYLPPTTTGENNYTAEDVTIEVNLQNVSLTEITLNNEVLVTTNYTVTNNTIVLNASYLSTLDTGTHTFTITTESGTVTFDVNIPLVCGEGQENINETCVDIPSESNPVLIIIAVAAGAGLIGGGVYFFIKRT